MIVHMNIYIYIHVWTYINTYIHVSHLNESRDTRERMSFICETHVSHINESQYTIRSPVPSISISMFLLYLYMDAPRTRCVVDMWDMSHSHVRHASFIRETWRIHVWDMTHVWLILDESCFSDVHDVKVFRNTVQHTATHCNTLQHTATHCNTYDIKTFIYQNVELMCRWYIWKETYVYKKRRIHMKRDVYLWKNICSQLTYPRVRQK